MSFMYVWNVNLYSKIIAEEIAMVYENNSQRFEHNILCDFLNNLTSASALWMCRVIGFAFHDWKTSLEIVKKVYKNKK